MTTSTVRPNFQQSSLSTVHRDRSQQEPVSSHPQLRQSVAPVRQSHFSLVSEVSPQQEGTSRQEILNQYLQDTGLLEVFSSWALLLAGLSDLPYNPYPTLAWYARRIAERFHMFDVEEDDLYQMIDNSVYTVGGHVARTHKSPAHWGLHIILTAVSPRRLAQYDWLLTSMSNDVTHNDAADYSFVMHKVVPVLVGPCVFAGSLYQEITTIQIRMEYGIAGPHIDGAAQIFAECVLKDVLSLEDEEVHILLDVSVPKQVHFDHPSWITESWEHETIVKNNDGFVSAVKSAALNEKMVSVECMLRLDPERGVFQRGQKQYNLTFIRVLPGGTACLSSLPYLSAFEGVFVSHSPAKDYLAWFENVQQPEHPPEFREPTTSTTKRSTGLSFLHQSKQSNQAADATNSRHASRTAGGHVTGTTDSAVSLTGGPYSDDIQRSIRRYLKSQISSLPGEENLFPMLHYVILLLLMDHRDNDESVESLLEAMRLVRSSVYKLHLIMEKNVVLQDLVTRFVTREGAESYLVQNHYIDYRHSLEELCCNNMQERSREFMVAGRVLLDRLGAITVRPTGNNSARILPLRTEVVKDLEIMNRYCTTVLMGMMNDALSFCPHLLHHFPTLNAKSQDLSSVRRFKHGVEVSSLLTQGSTYLNMEQAKQLIGVPGPIATPAAVLKYFVDTRFDQTFEEFLGLLLSGSSLPPNPYPRLVSHLRVAANSMEMFSENRDRFITRLLPASAQLVDSQNYVYHPPGCEAYGAISAVSALDSKAYNELLTKLRLVANKVNTRVTEVGFKATVDMAITGFTPLYGRMMPYVHEIELVEHYFIKGPRNAKADLIQHFTKLVFDHLEGFAEQDNPSLLFVGMFLGNAGVSRSLQDIVPTQRKKTFLTQLAATVKSRQPVYMKAYVLMEWRFVLVKKSFMLHYIEGAFVGYQRFYNQTPLGFYQNVFSNQEAASLFARACGPQDRSDPCSGESLGLSMVHVDHCIKRALHDGNLLDVYRWLLTKSLMSQDSSCVAEAWYMMHGAAAQLEYLQTLNKTLQKLVEEELSRTFAPMHSENTSLLDLAVLGRMFDVYSAKLHRVLELGTCMAPSGLMVLLAEKLDLVVEPKSHSQGTRLLIAKMTPQILQDINELLQPLLDSSAADLHQVCPDIHQALRALDPTSALI